MPAVLLATIIHLAAEGNVQTKPQVTCGTAVIARTTLILAGNPHVLHNRIFNGVVLLTAVPKARLMELWVDLVVTFYLECRNCRRFADMLFFLNFL